MRAHFWNLLAYKRWANFRVFDALKAVPDSTLSKPQKIKFGSIIATAQHVLNMDVVWRARLSGEDHAIRSRTPNSVLPIERLSIEQERLDVWFLNSLVDVNLDQIVRFTFLDGQRGEMSASDILIHVVNHGTYHRGHIADMLYDDDVVPPITDYPVFVREVQSAD
ncbi:MAG: DinB family protein [Pseudomonadota bacterium]